jgi:hypothetical protein
MPSLAHAYAKVRWAHKQLKELEVLCSNRSKVVKTKVSHLKIINKLPKHSSNLFTVPNSRVPFLFQILTGQIVNGLRSALDYLIANLAEIDSGAAKRRTQFPVEHDGTGFLGRKATFLKGLSSNHIAAIERLQPYNGCAWTRRMADLSNVDKHNALIPTKMDFLCGAQLDPIKGTKAHPSRYKVRMHITPTVYISVGKEFALVEALREIETGVTQTLGSFQAEFK